MATRRKIDKGPSSLRVAANMKRLRLARGLKLDDLAERMSELGRPILKSGLARIETGERRVDVDDLMALAIALETNTNGLLLDPESDSEPVQLTEAHTAQREAAWHWACGELSSLAGPWPWARFHPEPPPGKSPSGFRFQNETRPHDPPRRLSVDEWDQLQEWRHHLSSIYFAMSRVGLPDWMYDELLNTGMHYAESGKHPPEVQEALRRGEVVMTHPLGADDDGEAEDDRG